MKKRISSTLLVLALCLTLAAPVLAVEELGFMADGAASPFIDVSPAASYFDAVMWAYSNGTVKGTSNTTFTPKADCTRGQFALMLYRLAGKPDVSGLRNPFTDVRSGDPYYKAVLWAYDLGVIKGTSETTFNPTGRVTRGQLVLMLYRLAGTPDVSGVSNPFRDVKPGDSYYKAVLWAYSQGITKGTSRTKFSPKTTCKRYQLVTFLYRYDQAGFTAQIPGTAGGAYAAYLDLIQSKRSSLDVPYANWDTAAPKARRQTVAVLDVWGDETPELILAECQHSENIYNPLEPLSIYTYQNGQVVQLLEHSLTPDEMYDYNYFVYYILLQTSEGKGLYLYEAVGEDIYGISNWYSFSSEGSMTETLLYSKNQGQIITYYDGSGKEITYEENERFENTIKRTVRTVLFSGDLRWYGEPTAMTYNEAVAMLGG